MKAAGPQAKFMHCLPAERGVECTDGVMEAGAYPGWEDEVIRATTGLRHCLTVWPLYRGRLLPHLTENKV